MAGCIWGRFHIRGVLIGQNKILDVMRESGQTVLMAEHHKDGSEPAIAIRIVGDTGDVERVRVLMQEYGAYLANHPAGVENFCLVGYESELAGLPGAYVAPGGLLLALVDGEAAGCVALKELKPGAGGKALELKRLWVGAGFRGLGLGRRLMQAAIDHARGVSAEAIYLDTVPAAMPEANRLYAAMGFREIERYNDNPVANIGFFRLELPVTG